jgi:hypothetical protein
LRKAAEITVMFAHTLVAWMAVCIFFPQEIAARRNRNLQEKSCTFSQLGALDSIKETCCGNVVPQDCSVDFPLTCTTACAEVIVPFRVRIVPGVSGVHLTPGAWASQPHFLTTF